MRKSSVKFLSHIQYSYSPTRDYLLEYFHLTPSTKSFDLMEDIGRVMWYLYPGFREMFPRMEINGHGLWIGYPKGYSGYGAYLKLLPSDFYTPKSQRHRKRTSQEKITGTISYGRRGTSNISSRDLPWQLTNVLGNMPYVNFPGFLKGVDIFFDPAIYENSIQFKVSHVELIDPEFFKFLWRVSKTIYDLGQV